MKRKILSIISTISLALVLFMMPCCANGINAKHVRDVVNETQTRTINVSDTSLDYESVFNKFEDGKLATEGTQTSFEGNQTLNLKDFLDIDENSLTTSNETVKIKYNFSYDSQTNLVTLTAVIDGESDTVLVDTIEGKAFINSEGNIDALLDVDGDYVLLSELQDLGMIENCGLFKKLFKKVVAAVVAVVAVAAVAATVVATCGAGLGAVIAAGAIAGSVAGGVAGGVISYTEYGKLDWKWIVGGAVIGAALGAVTGWGVGSALCTPNTATYINKDFNFSETVLSHTDRPYRGSQLLAKEIMKSSKPIPDPGGIKGGLKWVVEGSFNGTLGRWELVYDVEKNLIVHFLFLV